jgi:hypothetical protein
LRIDHASHRPDRDAAPGLEALEHQVRRIVVRSGLSAHAYQAAYDGAAALLGEQPDNARYRDLRGMSAYRLGRIDEALADLPPAGETTVAADTEHARQSLAVRTMAEQSSENSETARAALAALRALVTQSNNPPVKETLNLIAEAEALLASGSHEEP